MGTPLILLHGALGAADQMAPLKDAMAEHFPQVFTLDFSGHGLTAAEGGAFSMARFAEDVRLFMEANGIGAADFFGYSMGGYVALELARARPERVRRIATFGTKFDWTPATAAQATSALDPEKWLVKAPAFVEMLQKRHGPANWLTVVDKTKTMMARLGAGDGLTAGQLAGIGCPVLVMAGSLDNTVAVGESSLAAERLAEGRFLEIAGAKHPFEQVDLAVVAGLLRGFFSGQAA